MIDQFGRYVPEYGYQPPRPPAQHMEIIKVNGRAGAEAMQMAPNSDVLLLDTSAPIVWLKSTDGAGYATCTPYTITPYQPEPQVSTSDLLARIERLEGLINEPNTAGIKRKQTSSAEQ